MIICVIREFVNHSGCWFQENKLKLPIVALAVIEYLLYKERNLVANINPQTVKLLKSKELLLGHRAEFEQLKLKAKILAERKAAKEAKKAAKKLNK